MSVRLAVCLGFFAVGVGVVTIFTGWQVSTAPYCIGALSMLVALGVNGLIKCD